MFTNKTSFPQESWQKSNKIMKSLKISWPLDQGPRNYIWATWALKIYPVVSPEPLLQFSHKEPIFLKNHEINPIKHEISKISWPWNLRSSNCIWVTWAQKTYPVIGPEPWLQFWQTRPHFLKNHEINPIESWNLKKHLDLGAWGLETTFGPLGSRKRIQPSISLEPWLQFSQAGPHFVKNHEMNPIKL